MIIESKRIELGNYYLPPFELKQGELLLIRLFNDANFYDHSMKLATIFIGRIENENVKIIQPMHFVEHIKETKFKSIFNPTTVGSYIKEKANRNNKIAENIYENGQIHSKTKVNNLTYKAKRRLSLYSALSNSNNIVFDLVGLDPINADEIFKVVESYVLNGGSAILLDWCDDMKKDCSKYVELQLRE